jgi:hypothetical protein
MEIPRLMNRNKITRVNSSLGRSGNLRGNQFKFVQLPTANVPANSRVSNRAYSQLSQLLDIQNKMQAIAQKTCYPWQISCQRPPQG